MLCCAARDQGGEPGHGDRDYWGDDAGDEDLGHDAAPNHAIGSDRREHGADHAANKGVRGARRQTEVPRQDVPRNGASETTEDNGQRHEVLLDNGVGDRGGHLE